MILNSLLESLEDNKISYSVGDSFVMGLIEKRNLIITILNNDNKIVINLSISFQSDFGDVEFFVSIYNGIFFKKVNKSTLIKFVDFIDFLNSQGLISEKYSWNKEDDLYFNIEVNEAVVTFQYLIASDASDLNEIVLNFIHLLKKLRLS
jgi:hypothetical protein